jgi:hypothetical protein
MKDWGNYEWWLGKLFLNGCVVCARVGFKEDLKLKLQHTLVGNTSVESLI